MPRHLQSALDADYSYDYASDTVRRKHPALKRLVAVLVVIVLLALAVGVAATYYSYRRLTKQAEQVASLEQDALAAMTAGGTGSRADYLDALKTNLSTAQDKANQANGIVSGDLWTFYSHISGYRDDVATMRQMAATMLSLANDTLPRYTTVLDGMESQQLYNGDGSLNVTPITDASTNVGTLNATVKAGFDQILAMAPPRDAALFESFENIVSGFSSVTDQLSTLSGMFEYLPNFLASDGTARTYIILAQASGTALAAGGPVETMGWMAVANGAFTMGDFYASEYWIADAGLNDVTADEKNLFSTISGIDYGSSVSTISANPNFPSVADQANDFWKNTDFAGGGGSADGVISFDPYALQKLVAITGDITLDDGTKLTADGTAEFLMNGIYDSVDSDSFATYYSSIVTKIVTAAFSDLTLSKVLTLSDTLVECASGRHAYLWSFHEDDQKTLRETRLAGNVNTDAANPVVGIYNEQKHNAAMDWYLHRISTVQKTGANTYHVTFGLNNTLGSAVGMSSAIVGDSNDGVGVGHQLQRMFVYTPAGATISNLTVQSGAEVQTVTVNATTVYTFQTDIGMAATDSIEFDVTCTPGSSDLRLDQTPDASGQSGITYDYGA